MRGFLMWLLVAAIAVTAYVLGTRAGRARYAQISATARRVWDDPGVKKVRTKTYRRIEKAAKRAAKKLS